MNALLNNAYCFTDPRHSYIREFLHRKGKSRGLDEAAQRIWPASAMGSESWSHVVPLTPASYEGLVGG